MHINQGYYSNVLNDFDIKSFISIEKNESVDFKKSLDFIKWKDVIHYDTDTKREKMGYQNLLNIML